MTNNQVINLLKKINKEIGTRLEELDELADDPGGEDWEIPDRQDEVFSEQSALLTRRHHLRKRLRARTLAKELKENVPRLSAARENAIRKALQEVSESIASANTFRAALRLAGRIAAAAAKANSAAAKV